MLATFAPMQESWKCNVTFIFLREKIQREEDTEMVKASEDVTEKRNDKNIHLKRDLPAADRHAVGSRAGQRHEPELGGGPPLPPRACPGPVGGSCQAGLPRLCLHASHLPHHCRTFDRGLDSSERV